MKNKENSNKEIESYENIFIKSEFLEILSCSICQNVYIDPKRISCGHTFCSSCIVLWLKTKNNCPLCRKKVNKNGIDKDIIADKIIHQLEVKCGYKGCPWEGKLEDYLKHKKNCFFEESKIPLHIKKYYFTNLDKSGNNEYDISNISQNSSLKERIYQKHKDLIDNIYNKNKSNISETGISNSSIQSDTSLILIENLLEDLDENGDNNKLLGNKRQIYNSNEKEDDKDIQEAIKRSLEDFI